VGDSKTSEKADSSGESTQLEAVLALLHKQGKGDFRSYKEATLLPRTRRRMCVGHISTLADYFERLNQAPDGGAS